MQKKSPSATQPAGRSIWLRLNNSIDRSIEAGFILPADRTEILSLAKLDFQSLNSDVRG
ncbi:hypothetical protein [Acidocella aquatica]|uniref:hypothetical protein n=1 Tax=Acidocella aquatica TaxID=1922313 RepID=UPI0024E0BD09|nr:hypothetical protein [Acidocella aquatica]